MNTRSNGPEAGSSASAGGEQARYDDPSIALHWATAALVFFQFALAESWGFFPKDTRHMMIVGHMSFGILLAVTILIRICWRQTFGRAAFETGPGATAYAARLMHRVLYALIVAEVLLGFLTRWTDNRALSFFGLLIGSPFGIVSRASGAWVAEIHDANAWLIMGLVMLHTAAALAHHYGLRDSVLLRMLPRSWSS